MRVALAVKRQVRGEPNLRIHAKLGVHRRTEAVDPPKIWVCSRLPPGVADLGRRGVRARGERSPVEGAGSRRVYRHFCACVRSRAQVSSRYEMRDGSG